MMYQVRRNGRYFLLPVSPDDDREFEISRQEFFDRWRACGGQDADIAQAEANDGDIDVL